MSFYPNSCVEIYWLQIYYHWFEVVVGLFMECAWFWGYHCCIVYRMCMILRFYKGMRSLLTAASTVKVLGCLVQFSVFVCLFVSFQVFETNCNMQILVELVVFCWLKLRECCVWNIWINERKSVWMRRQSRKWMYEVSSK